MSVAVSWRVETLAKASRIASSKGGAADLMAAARQLREVLEKRPDDFLLTAGRLGIARRKAYYLVEIDKTFGDLSVDRERLNRIGWTKLQILAGRVDRRNVGRLLGEAEKLSAYELGKLVNEEPASSTKSHVVLLRLTDDEYAVFRNTVRAFGAEESSTGLSGKEAALIAALRELKK